MDKWNNSALEIAGLNRRWSYVAVSLLLLVSMSCRDSVVGPVSGHVVEMKGFTYTSFNAIGFQQGGERRALEKLKLQIGNDWISLSVFEYQTSSASADIARNITGVNPLTGSAWPTSSTEADIRYAVRQARLQNMKIMLKPQVDLYTGEWRASIAPDREGIWFTSYAAMLEKYARLSRELHIEMLCVGSEFIVATQPQYTSDWHRLIIRLRQIYSGKLTYAANWSGDFADGIVQPEFEQIGFWSDLDYLGVDAYYPLTDAQSDTFPRYDAAVNRASTASQRIGAVSYRYAKSVIITEIGVQSVKGALAAPWDYSLGASTSAIPDNNAQDFYYRVMIDAIGNQAWCSGMFWWHWESVPSANAPTNYTPEDKPAAKVVRQWYTEGGI